MSSPARGHAPPGYLGCGETKRETADGRRSTQIEADGAVVREAACCDRVTCPATLERKLPNEEKGG